MENRLRSSVYDTILNSEYDIGEVWCNVNDSRSSNRHTRKEPFRTYPCWKSAKTTCLGKYNLQVNGYEQHLWEEASDKWDETNWLRGNNKEKVWKVWNTKPKKSIPTYGNRHYGGCWYDFRIQATKDIVEPTRMIYRAMEDTVSLITDGSGNMLTIGEAIFPKHCVVDVLEYNRFQMKPKWEVKFHNDVAGFRSPPSSPDGIQTFHWDIWGASVQAVLDNNGYSNVEFEFNDQTRYGEWVIL